MDLKDVILSTLAELEKDTKKEESPERRIPLYEDEEKKPTNSAALQNYKKEIEESLQEAQEDIEQKILIEEHNEQGSVGTIDNELRFLTSLRERVLVLFEGLQSPNNRNLEAKVDLILNFLEYQLSVIDERLDALSGRS